MSFLIDDLLGMYAASPKAPTQAAEDLRARLIRATAIHVQPVADYYYEVPKSFWELNVDFPNIAPPMPYMWMEWKEPKTINLDGKEKINDLPGTKMGALIQAYDCEDESEKNKMLAMMALHSGPMPKGLQREQLEKTRAEYGARWILNMAIFAQVPFSETVTPISAYVFLVSKTGEAIRFGEGFYLIYPLSPAAEISMNNNPNGMMLLIHIPMLALSFMHCKNISTELTRDSPERLNLKRMKNGKAPLRKIYTLKIDPMRKVLRNNDSGGSGASVKALHICRGHFKDFRDGRGLFGKYKGMYWWPMYAKGAISAGEVIKDYAVQSVEK